MSNNPQKALIALGSNATSSHGDPKATLTAALATIPNVAVDILAKSQIFRTPAFPPGSGADFANAAIKVETSLSEYELLHHLHSIEADFGRTRRIRWDARVLDLDLLAMGDRVLPSRNAFLRWKNMSLEEQMQEAPDQMILPHPRLQDRSFVLVPLAEVAPNWRHPVLGCSVQEMLAARPEAEKAEIVPF